MNWALIIIIYNSGAFSNYIPMQSESVCLAAKSKLSKNEVSWKALTVYECIQIRK